MSEKPILFSGEMVRAILDRRLIVVHATHRQNYSEIFGTQSTPNEDTDGTRTRGSG